jgi:hypothetical protein
MIEYIKYPANGTQQSNSHGQLNAKTNCEHTAHNMAAPQCTL